MIDVTLRDSIQNVNGVNVTPLLRIFTLRFTGSNVSTTHHLDPNLRSVRPRSFTRKLCTSERETCRLSETILLVRVVERSTSVTMSTGRRMALTPGLGQIVVNCR